MTGNILYIVSPRTSYLSSVLNKLESQQTLHYVKHSLGLLALCSSLTVVAKIMRGDDD